MIKNTASQKVGAQMVAAADGSAFTGSVTVSVTGDAGTQATGSVGSGACTHEGNGYHTYAPATAETNYDLIAFTFTGTGAVPQTVQVYTRATAPDVNVTTWLGSAAATPTVAGVPEVDVTHWIGTAAATPTVAGVPEVDVTHFGGSAATTSSGRPEVNTTHAAGTAWGSGAITAASIATDAIGAAELADGAITAATFAAGAIDAAAIADNAIDAATLASDVVTELSATVLAVTGALADSAADGAVTSTDTIVAYLKQIINTLEGTPGIPAWPSSAAPGNAVSIAEAVRQIYDEVAGVNGITPAAVADIPTAAVNAAAVWDLDATAHQTQGTFGQAIGDPAADTNTIFKAVVTDADGATVGVDVTNLPTNAELSTALGTADDAVLAAIAALNNLSSSAAATAVLTTAMTESYAADGATPTLAQAIYLIQQRLTEFAISGTTITIKKLDGSATAGTLTTDSATDPTSSTRAT